MTSSSFTQDYEKVKKELGDGGAAGTTSPMTMEPYSGEITDNNWRKKSLIVEHEFF